MDWFVAKHLPFQPTNTADTDENAKFLRSSLITQQRKELFLNYPANSWNYPLFKMEFRNFKKKSSKFTLSPFSLQTDGLNQTREQSQNLNGYPYTGYFGFTSKQQSMVPWPSPSLAVSLNDSMASELHYVWPSQSGWNRIAWLNTTGFSSSHSCEERAKSYSKKEQTFFVIELYLIIFHTQIKKTNTKK